MDVVKYIENKCQCISNESLLNIVKANKLYYNDFIKILMAFNNQLTQRQMTNLIDKFQLNMPFDCYAYTQHACELSVLKYIIDKFDNNFIYEPTYDSPKNPECSFEYKDKIVNIEVKCPNYKKRNEQLKSSAMNVMIPERFYDKKTIDELSKNNCIKVLSLLDNKLKDFLYDSHKKFPLDNDKYFNILVIALPSLSDMDEWYIYLFGDKGIFSNSSFIKKEATANIHAFVLTDIAKKHMLQTPDFHGNWTLDNCSNLFLPNPEIDALNYSAKCFYWSNALDMFGEFTRKYHEYILRIDNVSAQDWEKVKREEMSLVDYNSVHQTNKYMLLSNVFNAHIDCNTNIL